MLDNLNILIIAPIFNLSLLIDGILIGAVFALPAYGLALVWGVMNVKNIAQGALIMMGGYITWWMTTLGIHPLFGVPASFVVMWLFGWLLYRVVIYRLVDQDLFTSLLATFGIAIVLEQCLNLVFGSDIQTAGTGFPTFDLMGDGMINIPMAKLIAFLTAGILAVSVVLFMKKSRMGQAIRATAQDPRAARVMGINTDKVYAFTFSLNAAICGVAGSLIVMIWVIQPFFGIAYSIRAFVVVILAGIGNLPGVILAGLGMGVIEQFGGFILGAEYQQAIVVGLLVLVLIIRQIWQARQRQVVE